MEVWVVVIGAVIEGVVVVVVRVVLFGDIVFNGVDDVVAWGVIVCELPQEAINGTVTNNTAIIKNGNSLSMFNTPFYFWLFTYLHCIEVLKICP